MKLGRVSMLFDITYLVRVISAPNPDVWYASKIGQTYEVIKDGKGSNVKYRIGHLHTIPEAHCEVLQTFKVERYTKY